MYMKSFCLTDILLTMKGPQNASFRCSGKCLIINRRQPIADTNVFVQRNKSQQGSKNNMNVLCTFPIGMSVIPAQVYYCKSIACLGGVNKKSGYYFNTKTIFPCIGLSIIKIRRSWDRHIFIMGIPILASEHVYNVTAPVSLWKPKCIGPVG